MKDRPIPQFNLRFRKIETLSFRCDFARQKVDRERLRRRHEDRTVRELPDVQLCPYDLSGDMHKVFEVVCANRQLTRKLPIS